jgi:hypothetical protein
MKLAAAALLTQSQPTAKQGVAILEEARRSVTDEALKTNIEVALISGYGYLQDYAKVVEFTSDLRKKNPDSKHLFCPNHLRSGHWENSMRPIRWSRNG